MEDMALVLEKKERVFIHLAVMESIINKLTVFMENEARTCSMDFGCVTPEYVYRSWGGTVAIDDIAAAMKQVKLPM